MDRGAVISSVRTRKTSPNELWRHTYACQTILHTKMTRLLLPCVFVKLDLVNFSSGSRLLIFQKKKLKCNLKAIHVHVYTISRNIMVFAVVKPISTCRFFHNLYKSHSRNQRLPRILLPNLFTPEINPNLAILFITYMKLMKWRRRRRRCLIRESPFEQTTLSTEPWNCNAGSKSQQPYFPERIYQNSIRSGAALDRRIDKSIRASLTMQ